MEQREIRVASIDNEAYSVLAAWPEQGADNASDWYGGAVPVPLISVDTENSQWC